MDRAWHLRQDGQAFPVKFHLYCMGDDDLMSEAEVAAFLIRTNSKDQGLAKYVIDAWLAMLVEEELDYDDMEDMSMDEMIVHVINHLNYPFQYQLDIAHLLNIHKENGYYSDVESMRSFLEDVREDLEDTQESIKRSIDQQFCRVRYGGQYDSVAGNNELWCRVSSVNYNWANTIYSFVTSIRRSYRITHVTICRDSESDNGFASKKEYFYKAKDGTLYKHMPIEEYLEEEHEHNPVFESVNMNEGVLCTARKLMSRGQTYYSVMKKLKESGVNYHRDLWSYFLRREHSNNCKVS